MDKRSAANTPAMARTTPPVKFKDVSVQTCSESVESRKDMAVQAAFRSPEPLSSMPREEESDKVQDKDNKKSKEKGRAVVGPADPTSDFDVSTLLISSRATPKRGGAISLVAEDSESNGVTAVKISSDGKDLVMGASEIDPHSANEPVSIRESALGLTEAQRVAPIGGKAKSLVVSGFVEGVGLRFLVDTGAEISVVSLATLAKFPKALRIAFQDNSRVLKMANGEEVVAKGPVLCNITVRGRTVLEAICAMNITEEAILGMPAMDALGFQMSVAGLELLPTQHPHRIRSIRTSRVWRVTAATDVVIPPRSEAVMAGCFEGKPVGSQFIIEAYELQSPDSLIVGRTVSGNSQGRTPVRIFNPSDREVTVRQGEVIANAAPATVIKSLDSSQQASTVTNLTEVPEHVKALYEDTCQREQLSEEMQAGLKALLIKHAGLFAENDRDLGRTNLVAHDIDTGDAQPIRQPPRRAPIALQPELDKELDAMLEQGAIEPGQSPWASPVVLVRKKDGTVRFCVDYRQLNAVTRFDAYPLPRIDETIESLGGAKYFSTLDLLSGYWQVGLTEEAKLKSAFTTRRGLFLWNVMPFGLCNAPSTFERLMETVLQGLQWQTCLIYLDDIVVFAKSATEMLSRLDEVFTRLTGAGLKLKPRKCKLFATQTEYLGHIISQEGIEVSPDKIKAIVEWPPLETVTDVRSFLGTASYYRRFIKDFATIASPLHSLTNHGAEWSWTDEHQKSFEMLKAALSTTPVLKFPVPEAPYVLDTDASLTGIGAVLSQIVDGVEMVVGYASRTLSKSERNYCVTRRELLAVVNFVKHFRPYLYGRHFTVRTDHSSLQWLLNFKEPEGQVARWLESLSEYDFKVEHRPGVRHGNADGLSRMPCRQCGRADQECFAPDGSRAKRSVNRRTTPEDSKPIQSSKETVRLIELQPRWTTEEFREAQRADPDLMPFLGAFETQQKPSTNETADWPRAARRLLADWERLKLVEGVLRRAWFDAQGRESHDQFVVPRKLVAEILQQAHDNPVAGHMGEKRTLLRARAQFFWVGMAADVRDWCRSCRTCGGRRPPPSTPHHPMQRQVVSAPLQRVALDIMGPLDPPTSHGNRYLLVVVDYLTKWVEAMPMKDQTAETCAQHFVTDFVCRLGIPEQLHSDQGRQFESALFQAMCQLLNIKKSRTTALHPQSDGQTERANRTLQDMLAKLAHENPQDWDQKLPYALAAYRSSVHRVTGETPNRLMLGREVCTPLTLLAPPTPGQVNTNQWVEQLHENFRDTHELVVEVTKASHRVEAPRADRRQKGFTFEVGNFVWLYEPKPQRKYPHKLEPNRWSGPWEVTRRISSCVYAIKKVGTATARVVNVDRLAPYVRRDDERFPEDRQGSEQGVQEERETEVSGDDDTSSEKDDDQRVVDPVIQATTTRAQRARRRPAWQSAFELE